MIHINEEPIYFASNLKKSFRYMIQELRLISASNSEQKNLYLAKKKLRMERLVFLAKRHSYLPKTGDVTAPQIWGKAVLGDFYLT